MSKFNRRKQILTATLAIAMASAIAVNWYYNNENLQTDSGTTIEHQTNLGDSIYVNSSTQDETNEKITDVAKTEEYFAKAQLKRTQAHDEALDEIQGLLESGGDSKEIETLLEEYTQMIKLETDIENLITAKLDCNCLCIINGDQAEIVVESEAIDELYMLQITEIVSTQTDIPAENIIIIQAK